MKWLCLSLLFTVPIWNAFPQAPPVKFGDIPMEEMTMTSYPLDSSANAVVLVDYGEAHYEASALTQRGQMASPDGARRTSGWTTTTFLVYKRFTRIKILRKEGLYLGSVVIPLPYGSEEASVSYLRASTFNLEQGQIVETEMNKNAIFKERVVKHFDTEKLTLPAVKVGSVLEISYTVRTPGSINFPNWQFQSSDPVRWSEYWAFIPRAFVFQKYMQGYVPANVYEATTQSKEGLDVDAFHWICNDVPAFRKEPFMTTERDYVSKINFELSQIVLPNYPTVELTGTWEKLTSNLMKHNDFGLVISKSGFLKDKVEQVTSGLSDPAQKIEAIHKYVTNNVEWNHRESVVAGDIKKALEEKRGTSGDINLLLASMLDKAGFEVDMVLLSTRDHGFVRQQYPALRQFNYAIVSAKLGDKAWLLDATEKYLPYTLLPERCLNGAGLVVSARNSGWVDLASRRKARTVTTSDFSVSAMGDLNGKLSFTRDGYDAFEMRRSYYSKGEDKYVKDFFGSRDWHLFKVEFAEVADLNKEVTEAYDITVSEHASVSGDIIYINPFMAEKQNENPFKAKKREYPVDFGSASEKIYLLKLTLPDGYVIDEVPSGKIIALPNNGARFSYNTATIGNVINITSSLQINKSLFLQNEYANLREFFSQVVAKQAEQIVLKKK